MIVYLGLGSNLETPIDQLHAAKAAIANVSGILEVTFSSLYRSPPMGSLNQPNYVNAVMAIETDLLPLELLAVTQAIENEQGRVRKERWGSRTLDIDILLFGDEVLNLPDLIVPHYGMCERAFVLHPLFEISPNLIIPNHGKLNDLVACCPLDGLEILSDAASYLATASMKPLTHLDLLAMKQRGEKITCLTAYDASFGALIDAAGIEVILVGDSLGMVIQGHSTTLPVKINDMIYHTRCVTETCKHALVVSDLPFMTYATLELAAQNAALLIQNGGAKMVKLEGAKVEIIEFLVAQGISVCGHLGLLPQFIHQLGGYKVQGKKAEAAEKLLADALTIQNAGATMLILECVPADLAQQITKCLTIPVIGIGAGNFCDGQVLVIYDMLGISTGKRPRFSKNFLNDTNSIASALKNYAYAVKKGDFPAIEHSF